MIENPFDKLPTELLTMIFDLLPEEDRRIIMPKVCKCWRNISEKSNGLKKFARDLLKKRIERFKYSDEQVQLIIKLAINNNLISKIKEEKYSIKRGGSYFTNTYKILNRQKNTEKKIVQSVEDYYSEFFGIVCNPTNLKLSIGEGSRNDFRFSLCIQLNNNIGIYLDDKLQIWSGSCIKKKKCFSWKKVSITDKRASLMYRLVQDALTLQLRLYSEYFASRNLSILSSLGINKFEDIESSLTLNCDKNGLINGLEDNVGLGCIINKIQYDHIPILTWNLKSMVYEQNVTDFFRRAVFSTTVQKLNEKMGTEIN